MSINSSLFIGWLSSLTLSTLQGVSSILIRPFLAVVGCHAVLALAYCQALDVCMLSWQEHDATCAYCIMATVQASGCWACLHIVPVYVRVHVTGLPAIGQ